MSSTPRHRRPSAPRPLTRALQGPLPRPAARPHPDDADLLDALAAQADDQGYVCPDVRGIAAALGTSVVQVRAGLAALARDGRLVDVDLGVAALAGAGGTRDALPPRSGRPTPHEPLHGGAASAVLW